MRRPLSGALLGLILGLAVAVILQQLGIWPLDRLTVFLLPAVIGLLGMLLASMGRQGSTGTMVVALVITLPLAIWGALGFAQLGQKGELNGGCTVNANSDLDVTMVTDTSRGDPFRIAPQGGLDWVATSPSVFDDYEWRIWTEIGGIKYTLASETNQNNDGGSQMNEGDVSNVTDYANARDIPLDQIRGAIIVGGNAASVCDGFGFVSLEGDPFETLASQIALAVAILALIALILVIFIGRGAATAAGVATGATGAAAGTAGGDAGPPGGPADTGQDRDRGQELIDDLGQAAEDSGLGKDNED